MDLDKDLDLKKPTKWVIAFYVYNSNVYDQLVERTNGGKLPDEYASMKAQTLFLYEQIEKTIYSNDVSIVVFLADIEMTGNVNNEIVTKKEKLSVLRYEKSKDATKLKGKLVLHKDFLNQIRSFTDLTSLNSTTQYLNTYYNYEKIAIITYGHGSIFGINYSSEKKFLEGLKKSSTIKNSNQKSNEKHPVYNLENQILLETQYKTLNEELRSTESSFVNPFSYFKLAIDKIEDIKNVETINEFAAFFNSTIKNRYIKFGYELYNKYKHSNFEDFEILLDIEYLTNIEIRESFKKFKKKIDVFLMYNCSMQNFYSQYEFADVVDQFVSSVSGISLPGYNYSYSLNKLVERPSMSNKEFADSFLEGINDDWMKNFEVDIKESWMIERITLNNDEYQSIKFLHNEWIESILEFEKNDTVQRNYLKQILVQSRRDRFNLSANTESGLRVIDFSMFLNDILKRLKLSKTLTNPNNLIATSNNLYKAFQSLDTKIFYFADFFFDNSEFDEKPRGSIAICLPNADTEYYNNYETLSLIFTGKHKGKNGVSNWSITPSLLKKSRIIELVTFLTN